MSLHIPDLYERFPLYDAQGYHVAYGVRKVETAGTTICPVGGNRDMHTQWDDVREHIRLQDQARADQL